MYEVGVLEYRHGLRCRLQNKNKTDKVKISPEEWKSSHTKETSYTVMEVRIVEVQCESSSVQEDERGTHNGGTSKRIL